jgi:hypothetical protein
MKKCLLSTTFSHKSVLSLFYKLKFIYDQYSYGVWWSKDWMQSSERKLKTVGSECFPVFPAIYEIANFLGSKQIC